MERFCIITNRGKDEGLEVTKEIERILEENHKAWYLAEDHVTESGIHYTDLKELPENTECAIVLGGDGTILQAAHDLAEQKIPIIGINLGTLGFLAETERLEVQNALGRLFSDRFFMEERMMLSVDFDGHDGMAAGHRAVPDALNDLVITRSGFSRVIGAGIYVNGELVNVYHGDGVILSTPTGSTGYNLSAGGPILSPSAQMIAITPICPHSLNARGIVVSADEQVEVKICTSKKTQNEEAIATIDGSYAVNLKAGDRVFVKKAERSTKLIRFHSGGFYQILRKKLNGDGF